MYLGEKYYYPKAIKNVLRVIIIIDIGLQILYQIPFFNPETDKKSLLLTILNIIGFNRIINYDKSTSDDIEINKEQIALVFCKAITYFFIGIQILIYSTQKFQEYYLVYDHDMIPKLSREKYDAIISRKEPDINLGTFILYDKQKSKDGKYTKITPKYRQTRHKDVIMNIEDLDMDIENDENKKEEKEGLLMTDSLNLNLLESDLNLLNKVMMILEGRNSYNLLDKNFQYMKDKNLGGSGGGPNKNKLDNKKKTNDVLKIDFAEKKLKIISIVNKGINMILFSIDINVEQISDLTELLELSMNNFKKKISLVKDIDKEYEKNLKKIEDLNLQKATITRKNKEKSEKLLNFIVTELNKKKKNNMTLNEQINTLFAGDEKKRKEDEVIDEDKKEDKESDISLGSIGEDDKKTKNEKNQNDNNNSKIIDNKNLNADQINQNSTINNITNISNVNDDDEGSDLSLTDL